MKRSRPLGAIATVARIKELLEKAKESPVDLWYLEHQEWSSSFIRIRILKRVLTKESIFNGYNLSVKDETGKVFKTTIDCYQIPHFMSHKNFLFENYWHARAYQLSLTNQKKEDADVQS